MAAPAAIPVSLYQDSISQSLNAVIEERTPQMPVFNQATSKTTPKKPRAKRKPKVKQEPGIKREPTDWSAFDVNTESMVQLPEGCEVPIKKMKQEKITDHLPKVKKKHDRFHGMPEEEVAKRLLPDHLAENLDIVIVGINPGLFAAYVGHHYAGPGNHFWKCLYLSGLIPEPMNAYEDFKLLEHGIGFTNMCARTTRGSADLKTKEIKEGGAILKEKLLKYKPKIAAFNGKGIYEVFVGHKKFSIGKQPEKLEGTDTVVYVMPSSSARCAQLPRAVDKVPFYAALKKLRDHLKGDIKELDESEVVFPKLELKVKKEEPTDEGYDAALQGTSVKLENGEQSKPKPKKKRNRKSAEATVTSGEVAKPYSGEVNHPYSGEVTQPYSGAIPPHYSGPITCQSGPTVPYIKQERPFQSQDYGSANFANNFPYTTNGMTLPSAMTSQYAMSQAMSQAPYPFPPFRPPITQSNFMFNPHPSQIPNYTQHQMAHMSNNGFQPNWNQFQPLPYPYPLPQNNPTNQITEPSNQVPTSSQSRDSRTSPDNMLIPNSSQSENRNTSPINLVSMATTQSMNNYSNPINLVSMATSQTTNSGATCPTIKSEPIDDGYKECHLTQL
ncbi:hypothetical protein SNE40_015423 [Patella caerulea]|uniref:G/T mismatch-specific thymine DNA glycosylase n=1 Tax=Patella caerulea TaxID=87958 RepID=A0AAN8PS11_PATCE